MATAGALKWVRSKMGTGGDEDAQVRAESLCVPRASADCDMGDCRRTPCTPNGWHVPGCSRSGAHRAAAIYWVARQCNTKKLPLLFLSKSARRALGSQRGAEAHSLFLAALGACLLRACLPQIDAKTPVRLGKIIQRLIQ